MTSILTIPEFLQRGVQKWPDTPWCRTPDGVVTRAEIYADSLRCAGGLKTLGVQPGERVVIFLPNGHDFLRAWFALAMCGAISVAVNPAAHSELAAVVKEVEGRFVIAETVPEAPVSARILSVAELLVGEPITPVECQPDQPASFIQSSGSTGRPKLVIETHKMYTLAAEGYPYWLNIGEDDVVLTALPLSHLNAQAYSTLGSFGCGAELVLLPRFSAATFWQSVHEYRATVFNAIGAMLEILMNRPPSPSEAAHRVRICYSAPAPTPERHEEIEKRFGFRLVIGYAMSETPYGLVVPIDEPTVYGSMGRPRQHPELGEINRVRIVGEDGNRVEVGETGELQLLNPAITPGHFGTETEVLAMTDDGWLQTGDLAFADDAGNLFFAGRIKDMIRRRGENLSAADVENVLDEHPDVASSAVIGVPSPLGEDDIKAFIMVQREASLNATEVEAWCKDRLPPYKRPRYVEFVRSWPLTDTMKIAKKSLPRERTARETDLQPAYPG
ncbi:AMP-binding protein [Mycolicibacterium neoaurum]|uniref:AMP-binding protein n=1 Tax=Mycolicibacterium neoaurum TaxID=1795 RepID=UPI001F4CE8D4|nr:AMP-binding protein [Mycolicibacterium neoaurum]UNG43181.1 AMP-binding protein [Mycolicibacterium neoaurum]